MLDHHRRMFRYEAWANDEVMAGLERTPTPPGHAVALLAHIVAAEALWLNRLREKEDSVAVWPNWDLPRCLTEARRMQASWQDFLATLDAGELGRTFSYRSTDGKSWTSTVDDTLTHVIMHGVYHRAQIASTVRDEGFAPAYTDYIHATRNQHVR